MHVCAYTRCLSVRLPGLPACPAVLPSIPMNRLSREQGCQVVASLQASHFQPWQHALVSFLSSAVLHRHVIVTVM